MQIRPDGRSLVEFRKPVLQYNQLPGSPSLIYQVANNYFIIQINQSQNIKFIIDAVESSQLSLFQQKQAQNVLIKSLKPLVEEYATFELHVHVYAQDKTFTCQLFNASGFQLKSLPLAVSCYFKDGTIYVDDDRVSVLMILDDQYTYFMQAFGIHVNELNNIKLVLQKTVLDMRQWIKNQLEQGIE